jgi:hypothetical protein
MSSENQDQIKVVTSMIWISYLPHADFVFSCPTRGRCKEREIKEKYCLFKTLTLLRRSKGGRMDVTY